MSKKSLNSFELLGKINFDNLLPDKESDQIVNDKKLFIIQNLEAHFSNKGRAGKTVTIIKGFEGDLSSIKILAKNIKAFTGTGGSVKNGEIIIQGNLRNRIINYLTELGHNVKRIGG
ncbi:MAG: translation initiation factor [Flavobacteriaceae bacterium]|mgnify:CR=1 FL=1|nr:translation initiation factor [Flavobacteriaceae bacterium]